MLVKHKGVLPKIDPTAWIAPNAVVCGNVKIGPGCRIMYGAQVIAESGSITIGRECIVMENAVLRSSARHLLNMGDNCLILGQRLHAVERRGERDLLHPTVAEAASWANNKLTASP